MLGQTDDVQMLVFVGFYRITKTPTKETPQSSLF
jgi:hypothetical protein